MPEDVQEPPRHIKRKYSKKATKKQLIALTLINQGMKPTQAMLQAGYAKSTARNPRKKVIQAQAITNIVEKFHLELGSEGITTSYLAKKYREWVDASLTARTKDGRIAKDPDTQEAIKIPDYKTQIKAGEMLKDIFQVTPNPKTPDKGLTKRVTFEEFINSDQQTESA